MPKTTSLRILLVWSFLVQLVRSRWRAFFLCDSLAYIGYQPANIPTVYPMLLVMAVLVVVVSRGREISNTPQVL